MKMREAGYRRPQSLSRRRFLAGVACASVLAASGVHLGRAQNAAASVQRGPTTMSRVALTFDCGADAGYTASILDTLDRNGIACSFGMTGQFAQVHPELVERMVGDGHHLMNHSWSHPSFTGVSTGAAPLTYWQRREQIKSTESFLLDLVGVSTKPYFRPPYGDIDAAALSMLGEIGYAINAMWTIDLLGWNGLSQTQIVNRVAANHGNGYIYLMHVGGSSQEGPALQQIINELSTHGYGFATLPQMLAGTGTDPTPPPARFLAGDTVRTTANLHLRSGAGTSASVRATMPGDTSCTVVSGPTLANGYAWYQLETPFGQGWAADAYLEKQADPSPDPSPVPAEFAAGDTVRVTTGLYLRSGASSSSSVREIMDAGTVCTVVSGPISANGYGWYELDTPYGRGWAAGEWLEKTTAPRPSPTPDGYSAGTELRTTTPLRLRAGPTTSSDIVATMPVGTACTVVSGPQSSGGYTWYQVDTAYGRGWAASEYLAVATPSPAPVPGGFPVGTRLRTTGSGLRLRSSASTSASVVASLPLGTICTVVGGPQAGGGYTWYQVDTPYGRGWAAGEYMTRV